MSIEFGILNYGVLLLVASELKRDKQIGSMIAFAFLAHAVLIWGVVNWIKTFF